MRIKYLIRKRQLGDVLWIEPVIEAMAKKHKKLIVFTTFNVLFQHYPHKNVVFKNKLTFFEKVFARLEYYLNTSILFVNLDNSYEQTPQMHVLHAYQQKAGLPLVNQYPKLFLSDNDKRTPFINSPKYAVLHIESFSDRNYRKVYGINWGEIVAHLTSKGFEVIQIGKAPEVIEGSRTVKTSIGEMINVIYHARLFIGIDSGPSHIAASLQVPSLIFFGAINPEYRHFTELFRGFFLQQYCEFAGCYHLSAHTTDPDCKLVPNNEIPKCSLHSNKYVLEKIDLLFKTFFTEDVSEN